MVFLRSVKVELPGVLFAVVCGSAIGDDYSVGRAWNKASLDIGLSNGIYLRRINYAVLRTPPGRDEVWVGLEKRYDARIGNRVAVAI